MKKALLTMAIIMMAATSYNQTSRRSANNNAANRVNRSSNSSYVKAETRNSSKPTVNNNSSRNRTTTINNSNPTNRVTRSTNSANSGYRGDSRTRNSNSVARGTNRSYNNKSYGSNRNAHRNVNTKTYHSNRNSSRSVNAGTYHYSPRVYRGHHHVRHHHKYRGGTVRYTNYYTYRKPAHIDVYWTNDMRCRYAELYPGHTNWNYHIGFRISTIPAGRAYFYTGDVRRVYGRVNEVFYSRETDEYFLYVGDNYPYQEFTVVVPGRIARKYSRHPAFYFENQHITATGLITSFEGEPELVVRRSYQLDLY